MVILNSHGKEMTSEDFADLTFQCLDHHDQKGGLDLRWIGFFNFGRAFGRTSGRTSGRRACRQRRRKKNHLIEAAPFGRLDQM